MRKRVAMSAGLLVVAFLIGCGPAPMVELTSPRIMLHVEGDRLTNVEPISGNVKVEEIDEMMARVHGTGVVRINDYHTVEVKTDGIRVHGVDVESRGAMRDVFIEKNKINGGVHPDQVKK